jgi:hypothetical protein
MFSHFHPPFSGYFPEIVDNCRQSQIFAITLYVLQKSQVQLSFSPDFPFFSSFRSLIEPNKAGIPSRLRARIRDRVYSCLAAQLGGLECVSGAVQSRPCFSAR